MSEECQCSFDTLLLSCSPLSVVCGLHLSVGGVWLVGGALMNVMRGI